MLRACHLIIMLTALLVSPAFAAEGEPVSDGTAPLPGEATAQDIDQSVSHVGKEVTELAHSEHSSGDATEEASASADVDEWPPRSPKLKTWWPF